MKPHPSTAASRYSRPADCDVCVLQSLGASEAAESGADWQRSRQLVLVRRSLSDGFGFTLRHFIAYPDDEPVSDAPQWRGTAV